jgi:hypothetical protein
MLPVQPPHVARCSVCGNANWGCVGSAPDTSELWGCLSCLSSDVRSAQCQTCGGLNIVLDRGGQYCVSCKSRPGKQAAPDPTPVYLDAAWSPHRGFLRLTDPLTGEMADIEAKGLPKSERWLYDRIDMPKTKTHDHQSDPVKKATRPRDDSKLPPALVVQNPQTLTKCHICGSSGELSSVTGRCWECIKKNG